MVYAHPSMEVFYAVIDGGLRILRPHKETNRQQMVSAILKEYGSNVTGDDLPRAIAESVGDILFTKDVYFTARTLAG